MGEPMYCAVQVKFPTIWGDDFEGLDLIRDVLGDWYEPDPGDDPFACWHFSGTGNYGLLDSRIGEALDWFRKHRVPFIARNEPDGDLTAELWIFDGFTNAEYRFDSDGDQPMLTHQRWLAITNGNDEHFGAVGDYFAAGARDISTFDISHLSPLTPGTAFPPPSEADRSTFDVVQAHRLDPTDRTPPAPIHYHFDVEAQLIAGDWRFVARPYFGDDAVAHERYLDGQFVFSPMADFGRGDWITADEQQRATLLDALDTFNEREASRP